MMRPIASRRRHERGFTLIELFTTMMILAILVGIALPNYKVSIINARETVLRENLNRMRDVLTQYYADKGEYPATLEVLVTEGYFRQLPIDPMTRQSDWEIVYEEQDAGASGKSPGVYDVKSSSTAVSPLNSIAYNQW